MTYLKKLSTSLLYIIIGIIVSTFFITILSYLNLISQKTNYLLLTIFTSISMIIGGYILGKNSNKKRWIEGLKLGLITSFIFIIINLLIFKYNYTISNLIYFIILTLSSILGCIFGRKNKEN